MSHEIEVSKEAMEICIKMRGIAHEAMKQEQDDDLLEGVALFCANLLAQTDHVNDIPWEEGSTLDWFTDKVIDRYYGLREHLEAGNTATIQ